MDGILVLAKPQGPTSHDMVALVRRLSGIRRVGHGGTLDPFASGVLPLFLGKATRVVEYHLGATKQYRATVCFGASSTTDDLEGELTHATSQAPTRAQVEAGLADFRGEIAQRPPAFSAIKVGGRRAYAMARAGETPELAARRVTIYGLELTGWDDTDPARPVAELAVTCAAGTYIRALARDLGEALGNAAYLGALTRTVSGPFTLADALAVDTVRAAAATGEDGLKALLRPLDVGLETLPVTLITTQERGAISRGQFIRPVNGLPPGASQDAVVRLVDKSGLLVALGKVLGQRIAPDKVLVDAEPGQTPAAALDAPSPDGPDPDLPTASAIPAPASPVGHRAGLAVRTRVVNGLDALTERDGPLFVVVGVFDGLHLGHEYLVARLRTEAARRDARPAVVTFDAHPDEILVGSAPPILCDPDERLARLASAGIEVTVVQHFDRALRMTPYPEFVAMITRRTGLRGLLMTPDAAFGYERRGTPDALAELGRTEGFDVVVVPPFQIDGQEVRSSAIRSLIGTGDLRAAAALLGRAYAFVGERLPSGEVSTEASRRATLRFRLPVALPPTGTYSALVEHAAQPGDGANPLEASVDAELSVPAEGGPVEIRAAAPLPAGERLRVTLTA